MKEILSLLLFRSISLSFIFIIFVVIHPFLSKKYSWKGLYYTWLIIIITFITPINFHMEVDTPTLVQMNPFQILQGLTQEIMTINDNPITPTPIPTAQISISKWVFRSWDILLFSIWAIGVLCVSIYYMVSHIKFISFIKRWSIEPENKTVLSILQECKDKMGIQKDIKVNICPYITSPMLIGIFHPCIMISEPDLPNADLKYVITHELTHYKRKDLLYKVLLLITLSIHWFNPIIKKLVKIISELCEISCDEAVVGNKTMHIRNEYVETIIQLMSKKIKQSTIFSTQFYGDEKFMKKRIRYIFDMRPKKNGLLLLLSSIFIALLIGTTYIPSRTFGNSIYNFEITPELREEYNAFGKQYGLRFIPGISDGIIDDWNDLLLYFYKNGYPIDSHGGAMEESDVEKNITYIFGQDTEIIHHSTNTFTFDGNQYIPSGIQYSGESAYELTSLSQYIQDGTEYFQLTLIQYDYDTTVASSDNINSTRNAKLLGNKGRYNQFIIDGFIKYGNTEQLIPARTLTISFYMEKNHPVLKKVQIKNL